MFIPIGDANDAVRHFPFFVWLLFLANCLGWYFQIAIGPAISYGFSLVPYEIFHGLDLTGPVYQIIAGESIELPQLRGPEPIYLTLISSMFLHGSWMHLGVNLLYLMIFADQIEDIFGSFMFIIFYLVCGVAAGLTQVVAQPESYVPCVGASGAIAGVLGSYLVRFPTNPVHVLFFRGYIILPAFIVLGAWFVMQVWSHGSIGLLSEVGKNGGQNVAYLAHIGGFACGSLLTLIFAPTRIEVDSQGESV